MPFKSKAQQRFLFSQKPELANEMASKTPKSVFKKLPEFVHKAAAHVAKHFKM